MTLKRMMTVALAALAVFTLCVGCASDETPDADTAATTTTADVTTTTGVDLITAETKIGIVEASTYIVRNGPGLDYDSPGGLQAGEEVVIVDREGDWYKIEFGDGFGYINSQYVTVQGQTTYTIKETTTTTVTTTTAEPTTTATDENGNVITAPSTTGTTGESGATAPTANGITTTTVLVEFEHIPGVEIVDQW